LGYKTDFVRPGHIFTLLKQTNKFVPCKQLPDTLPSEGEKKGALLITSDGSMLTRDMFASALIKVLYKIDLNTQLYNTHSFRIGAATSANQAGIPDLHIKTLGRWRSDSYQQYIRISPASLASMTKHLISKPTKHV